MALADRSKPATMSVKVNDKVQSSLVDVLPPEIIRRVCRYLEYEDVPNFRLASKTCADAGIQMLVHTLYVIYTKESFEKLLNISKHSELSKYVRAICYAPIMVMMMMMWNRIPQLEEAEDVTTGGEDLHVGEDGEGRHSRIEKTRREIEAFKKIDQEQQSMKKGGYSKSIFSQALPNFRGLTALSMDPMVMSYQSQRLYSDIGSPLHVDEDLKAGFCDEALKFLAVAGKAGTKLKYLYLDKIGLDILPSVSVSSSTIFSGPEGRYLRQLLIGISEDCSANSSRGLVQLLQATFNLEDLTISIRRDNGDMDLPHLYWNEFAREVTLPNLESLQIAFMSGNSISLTGFLQRHARTLRFIRMHSCRLKGDTREWSKIFDTIKNDMTLDDVVFNGKLFSDPPSNDIKFSGYRLTDLTTTYFGHSFESLLKDRLLNENALAQECDLTLSALWDGYVGTDTLPARLED
ncbi:hypothetical protein NHQ30_007333 [Ciborinia camelliae]|nr:hypothetical protein NHQ30_007333 [Ciborinia camelliae]